MTTGRTVLAALPRAILDALADLGHDADACLAAAGLTAHDLVELDARVPLARHVRLWEAIARIGPTIGLDLGARIGLRALGVLGFVVEHRATIGEALRDLERFRRLVLEDAVPRLVVRRGPQGREEAALVQTLPARVARLGRPAEAQVATSFTTLRALAGDDFRALAISFPHPTPQSLAPYRALFGLWPTFGAPHAELMFDARWLTCANRRANPALADYLAKHAAALAANLEDPSWVDRAKRVLADTLTGDPTPSSVARTLGTSTRTLQRRLTEGGTSFAALLDEARHERALVLLADPNKTASEVARAVGFQEPATFFRAFRRWTGLTPSEHRAGKNSTGA